MLTATDYEAAKRRVTVKGGSNIVKVRLDKTLAASYRAFFAAYKVARYEEMYQFMHPDYRQRTSFEEFKAIWSEGGGSEPVRLVLGKSTLLEQWHVPDTNRRYESVQEVRRTIIWREPGAADMPEEGVQYWKKVDNTWYVLFPTNP